MILSGNSLAYVLVTDTHFEIKKKCLGLISCCIPILISAFSLRFQLSELDALKELRERLNNIDQKIGSMQVRAAD